VVLDLGWEETSSGPTPFAVNPRGREKHRGDRRQLWPLNVCVADDVLLCVFSHASSGLEDA
jgi:hypothetical protein